MVELIAPDNNNKACFHSLNVALDTNISAKRKNELKRVIVQNGGVVHDFITSKVLMFFYYRDNSTWNKEEDREKSWREAKGEGKEKGKGKKGKRGRREHEHTT